MHLVSSFEGFALYLQSLRLQSQLNGMKDLLQYQTLKEKIFRLMSFAREKLEQALESIPVLPISLIHLIILILNRLQDSVETLIHLSKVEAWLAANAADRDAHDSIRYAPGGRTLSILILTGPLKGICSKRPCGTSRRRASYLSGKPKQIWIIKKQYVSGLRILSVTVKVY